MPKYQVKPEMRQLFDPEDIDAINLVEAAFKLGAIRQQFIFVADLTKEIELKPKETH